MWFKPKRPPDELIPPTGDTYMRRWFIFRKCRIGFLENIYLHQVVRSDDDRALHDHPWWNISIVLKGGYMEYMPANPNGYKNFWDRRTKVKWRGVGSIVFRRADSIHRLELPGHSPTETWTLFITGKKSREWGFWCPHGWRHWHDFGKHGCN